jgi:hypothetical protein
MEAIFARQGYPDTIKTDNGPPFQGIEFSEDMKSVGIYHRKITPVWPEANGEVECFMKTLNKLIKASISDNIP